MTPIGKLLWGQLHPKMWSFFIHCVITPIIHFDYMHLPTVYVKMSFHARLTLAKIFQ